MNERWKTERYLRAVFEYQIWGGSVAAFVFGLCYKAWAGLM